MNRKNLIREGLVLTCFLEGIRVNEKDRVRKVIKWLQNITDDELNKYYEINLAIKEKRIDRLLNY